MNNIEDIRAFYTIERDPTIKQLDLETRFISGDSIVPIIIENAITSALHCHLTDVVSSKILSLKDELRLDFIQEAYAVNAMNELPADIASAGISGIKAIWDIMYLRGVELYTLIYRQVRVEQPQLLQVKWNFAVVVAEQDDQFDVKALFRPTNEEY